jgi:hypothetical protein
MTLQEYLQRTDAEIKGASVYQQVIQKARQIRAKAQQEAEHGFDQEELEA